MTECAMHCFPENDIKVVSSVYVLMDTTIHDLEKLKRVLLDKNAQRGLVELYGQSQSECTRNGACGMEVGMSREKDLGAVLKLFLKEQVDLELDNALPEDYVIGKAKISAKHSGAKVGTPVKAKWTSADVPAKDAIESMIHAEDCYYPHLLLTYIDTRHQKITIICISSDVNKSVIKTLQGEHLRSRGGTLVESNTHVKRCPSCLDPSISKSKSRMRT